MSEKKYSEYELINKILNAIESLIDELPFRDDVKGMLKDRIRKVIKE